MTLGSAEECFCVPGASLASLPLSCFSQQVESELENGFGRCLQAVAGQQADEEAGSKGEENRRSKGRNG